MLQMLLIWSCSLIVIASAIVMLYFHAAKRIGADPSGERLARIRASPNSAEGKFQNVVPTHMDMPSSVMMKVLWQMLKGGEGREPRDIIHTVPFDRGAWDRLPDTGHAIAWFGHSSLLIKMDGITLLTDPLFGERASTFSFAGPKRFAYTEHLSLDLLPHVDIVLLTHDHYDHLDHEAIARLKDKRFIAPLGVGAHLEKWGVPAASITEKDRWESIEVQGVKLTLAPARHFSGRGLRNRNNTLWGSWIIEGRTRKVYFGADSGYSPTFKEIGDRFGPFDLALLECGAYNAYWASIHMMPEEVAQAAVDVQAKVLMPIHWGKFSLALHPWKEPMERLELAITTLGVHLFTPRIGRIVVDPQVQDAERWWVGLR